MADNTSIRPFQVNFPEADVTDLRRRIKMTRWPERELVSDAASRRIWSTPAAAGPTQGVQLATMQKPSSTGEPSTIGAGAKRG